MEALMNGAMVIEGGVLSFLLALWMTWIGLRGLFRLMPMTNAPASGRVAQQIQFVANREEGNRHHDVA
jgi:hypothetical protein